MKTKLIILSLVFLFSGFNTNAQLLKKLKEAVKQGVDAVEGTEGENEQTESKTDHKAPATTKADEMPPNMGEIIPAPPDNNVKLPDTYNFSYRATMQINNNNGTVEPVFYLQPDAQYYAQKQTNKGLTEFLVLDNQNNLVVIFAELEGQKRRMHNGINLETKATLMGAYRDAPQKEPVKTLESKTILGYRCQGYQIDTEAGTTQLWITDDAPASLFGTMLTQRVDDSGSPFSKNSMIMEVIFTSTNAPEKNYQMVCTGLEPDALVLNKIDYEEAM